MKKKSIAVIMTAVILCTAAGSLQIEAQAAGVANAVTDLQGTVYHSTIATENDSLTVLQAAVISDKAAVYQALGSNQLEINAGNQPMITFLDSQCGTNAKNSLGMETASLQLEARDLSGDASFLEALATLDVKLQVKRSQIAIPEDDTYTKDPITVKFSLPSNMTSAQKNRTADYAVLSLKTDGSVEVLPDLDTDPDTVTIETKNFRVFQLTAGSAGAFEGYRAAELAQQ